MDIISTNIGSPVVIEWNGQQIETGIFKYSTHSPIYLGVEDVLNDHVINRKYHGGPDKACYLYSTCHYPFWKEKFPNLDWQWGMFGENLTVNGFVESEVRIGDKFRIGGAVVQVSQPRQPCFKLGLRFGDQTIVDQFWSMPFPGIYVRVIKQGEVKCGDEIVMLETNPSSLTVRDVYSIFSSGRKNLELIQKALAEPYLAQSCKNDIQKIFDAMN